MGGHVIFSHYDYFDKLLEASVGSFDDETKWKTHRRESYVRYKGSWVPYPFQNNLCRVPAEDQVRIINGMVDARVEDAKAGPKRPLPENFDEWIVRTMGEGMADVFMRPYNFKVWAIPPSLMQWSWLGERVSVVDPSKAITNVLMNREETSWGPNAVFRFPCNGGTGAIWKAVARRLPQERLLFNQEIVSIDLEKREATTKNVVDGSTSIIAFQRMISTLPLDLLVNRIITVGLNKPMCESIASRLVHSTSHIIGLGIRGRNPHGTKCWLYFPEDNCPFYRATVFSNYGPGNVPAENKKLPTLRRADGSSVASAVGQEGPWWSLMLEVSESVHKPVDGANVVEDTIRGCIVAGLMTGEDEIVSIYHRRIEHGYPTPSLTRDAALSEALPVLRSKGIWSRGRFGSYKYEIANQDHSLVLGVEAVDNMFFGREETTLHQPGYVNRNVGSAKNMKPEWDSIPSSVGASSSLPSTEGGKDSNLAPEATDDSFVVGMDRYPTVVPSLRRKSFQSVSDYIRFVNSTDAVRKGA